MKAPGSKMALHQGGPRFTIEIIKKNQNLLLQNLFAQILKFNIYHCLVVFCHMYSNGGVQNGPAPESPRFES